MQFPPTVDCSGIPERGPLASVIDDNLSWLRTFYFSCYGVFVWPVVIEAAGSGAPITDSRFAEAVQHMSYGICGVIASVSQYMNGRFHFVVWTHAQTYPTVLLSDIVCIVRHCWEC
jgi:hypothetical protein